ncbi:MAG: hypothetical protein ACRDL5_06745 [Solirubrobacteraceae bacterium]
MADDAMVPAAGAVPDMARRRRAAGDGDARKQRQEQRGQQNHLRTPYRHAVWFGEQQAAIVWRQSGVDERSVRCRR